MVSKNTGDTSTDFHSAGFSANTGNSSCCYINLDLVKEIFFISSQCKQNCLITSITLHDLQ